MVADENFEEDNSNELGIGENTPGSIREIEAPKAGMRWYSIYVQSGCEQKALEGLQHRIKNSPLSSYFGEILIPKVADDSNKAKKLMPGYIFIQMVLNDDTWELVRRTPKVLGFIGGYKNPPPIPDDEILHIKEIVESKGEALKKKLEFNEGESVAIIDGPFKDFYGTIIGVDQEKMKLTVEISIFGRQTPVQVDYTQVTKK